MDLEYFKYHIVKMAEEKGWNNDYAWLALGLFKESGELIDGIEHKQTEEEIGQEFADIMHFLLQLMHDKAPSINLDIALQQKIDDNRVKQKKTYVDGKIVMM